MTGSDLIEMRRHRLDMTQRVLAQRLGVHYTTVARWESGRTAIPKAITMALKELVRREQPEAS